MDREFDDLLKKATAEELLHVLNILETEKIAEIITTEIQNHGSAINETDIERIIYAVFRDKQAESTIGDSYGIIDWLNFWFGKDMGGNDLAQSGVFFDLGDKYIQQLHQYALNYQKQKVDVPTAQLDHVKQRIAELDQAIENKDRQGIQGFIDEFAPRYKLTKEGYLQTIDRYDVEKGLPASEKGNFGSYSNTVKGVMDRYNQLIKIDRDALIKELTDVITNRVLEIKDKIESTSPYNTANLDWEKEWLPKYQKGLPIVVGLKHLVDDAIRNIEFYEENAPELSKKVEKHYSDLKKLKNEEKKINDSIFQASTRKKQLEELFTELEVKIQQESIQPTADGQARVQDYRAQQEAIKAELNAKRYDVTIASNTNRLNDLAAERALIGDELGENQDSARAYVYYKKKEKEYKAALFNAEKELARYETAFEILNDKNFKNLSDEEVKEKLRDVNSLLSPRERVQLPSEIEHESTPIHEEGKPEEELVSFDVIKQLRDKLVSALNNYQSEQGTIQAEKNKINAFIQEKFKELEENYTTSKKDILESINNLKKASTETPNFNLIDGVDDLQAISGKYKNRLNYTNEFRKQLMGSDNLDASNIIHLTKKSNDQAIHNLVHNVAHAIAGLTDYIKQLESDPNAYASIQKAGVDHDLLARSLNELIQVGKYDVNNPYGVNSLLELTDKLKSTVIPAELRNSLTKYLYGAVKDIIRCSEKHLHDFVSASNVLVGAVRNVTSKEFIDINKLSDMFEDGKKTAELKDLLSEDYIQRYMANVSRKAVLRDTEIKENVHKKIMKSVAGLNKLMNVVLKDMKKEGEAANERLYGDRGKINSLVEERNSTTNDIQVIDSNIARLTEKVNSGSGDEDDKADLEEFTKRKKEKEDYLNSVSSELKTLTENMKGPAEINSFVDRALFPQKAKVIVSIGDFRDSEYGDPIEQRTALDVLSGVETTKEHKVSPSSVAPDKRNLYSILRVWKGLVNQCRRSIVSSMKDENNQYASRTTEYSPEKRSVSEGPLRSELKNLATTGQSPDKIKYLQNILDKLSYSPSQVVSSRLQDMQAQYRSNPTKEGRRALSDLWRIYHKVERGELTTSDKREIDSIRYTPEERSTIEALKKKWQEQLPVVAGEKLVQYKSMLDSLIKNINAQFAQEKQTGKFMDDAKRKALQEKRELLWVPLFKIKYNPQSLTPDEIKDLDQMARKKERDEEEHRRLYGK